MLPTYVSAVRASWFWRIYSLLLTAAVIYLAATFRRALWEHRTYFVVRVDEKGQVTVSNPVDWWEYQRPSEREAAATAGMVAQLLLDATAGSLDKQFAWLLKRGLLERGLAREIERRFSSVAEYDTPQGPAKMTLWEYLRRTGQVCDVTPDPQRFTVAQASGGYRVRIMLRRDCVRTDGVRQTRHFLADVRLALLPKRSLENPNGLVVVGLDFYEAPPDYDPRGTEEAPTGRKEGTP